MFVDQIGHLAHLYARDTSFALVSRAPLAKITAYKKRMGWTIPWHSSFESDFNVDFGVSPETPQADVYQDGETFGRSVFLRDGDCSPGTVSVRLDLDEERSQKRVKRSPIGRSQGMDEALLVRHVRFECLVDRRLALAGQPDECASPVVRIWPALDETGLDEA